MIKYTAFILFNCAVLCLSAHAEVAISDVRASQRAGANVVDIHYEVTGTTDPVSVSVALSDNGGATYVLSPSTLSGDIGAGIAPGTNRHIVWDAGADFPDYYGANMRFRVTASEAGGPATAGFVLIPSGSFDMGESFGDGYPWELPVHTVVISAFYMGRTEVTKEQWDAVRAWAIGSGLGYTDLNAGGGKGPNHPVHSASWCDAVKWLNAWSEKDGLNPVYRVGGAVMRSGESVPTIDYTVNGYRLPTEAEWEKAARGGLSGRRFPWGDTISHSQANYYSAPYRTYDVSPTRGYHPDWDDGKTPYTSPVRTFPPNGYGLYDMAGNLLEWCGDYFSSIYYDTSPGTDPTGPASGSSRVLRGGFWDHLPHTINLDNRVSFREFNGPGYRSFHVGFRPARSE